MKGLYLFFPAIFFASIAMPQNTSPESKKILTFGASYIGDNVINFSGGINTGYAYLGLANLEISLDFENAGLWKGGLLYVHAANTHGSTPSADMLGDIQVASNIEAGNHTYLQEFWFMQTLGQIELTAGLQDLNVQFANTDHGALFLNSSFGILPVISGNIPAPIFPLTSLGITTKWNISDNIAWLNAVYDGYPTDFKDNPHNIRWRFESGDGILAISEIQHHITIRELPGTYKLGIYSHNHIIENNLKKDLADSLNYTITGMYVHADQKISDRNGRSIGAFLQAGYSPSEKSMNKAYLGFGINASGFLSKSKNDVLGLAVAHGSLNENTGCETTFELTWQKQINNNISIQPDIQYIIQPSGKISNLSNCLAAIVRINLVF